MKFPTDKSVCPFCKGPLLIKDISQHNSHKQFSCTKSDHEFYFRMPPYPIFGLEIDGFECAYADDMYYVAHNNIAYDDIGTFEFDEVYDRLLRFKKLYGFT